MTLIALSEGKQKKLLAATWSFNKCMEIFEISSAVERMVLPGGSKVGKNETYDSDTLQCAYIFISTAFYML